MSDMCAYERGEWNMFVAISNTYHGKQYYFLQDNGTVYSRDSGGYMSVQEAYDEFIKKVGDN